jgi:hypothetical protein
MSNQAETEVETTNEKENQVIYSYGFLCQFDEDIDLAVQQYFKAHMLPKVLYSLINEYAYLEILKGQYDHPEKFTIDGLKGYNREIEGAVKDLHRLIGEVADLAEKKLQSLSKEEFKAAEEYNLFK